MLLTQKQFEHIIDLLILYKQINPKKEVYLSERSIKDATIFMVNYGGQFAEQLGITK